MAREPAIAAIGPALAPAIAHENGAVRVHLAVPNSDHCVPALRFRGFTGRGIDHTRRAPADRRMRESISRMTTGRPGSSSRMTLIDGSGRFLAVAAEQRPDGCGRRPGGRIVRRRRQIGPAASPRAGRPPAMCSASRQQRPLVRRSSCPTLGVVESELARQRGPAGAQPRHAHRWRRTPSKWGADPVAAGPNDGRRSTDTTMSLMPPQANSGARRETGLPLPARSDRHRP